ncbi:Procollagen C-endopeptidase enhancer 2 [Clonorchis sinensis]|uniref:Procollagen C-endopeptidase enhancer 2 n=1 Tax=Clonorchis sinensis TaxID=79923 RepID=A0A8T1MDH5_CLOSI|nr:Procollagen C-endopeptidase enhancer 2 [Clonorchis sinensis]
MLFLPLVCCVFGLYVACGLECGEVLKGESGEFRSPGYPVVYPDNLNCTWNIYKPRGLSVLVFPTFEVEESYTGERCEYDFVHITVGTGDDQVIHGPFCGFKPPAPIVFQKHVTVQFISDGSRAFQGFEAVFLLVKTYIPTPPRIEHTTEAQQEVSTQNADVPVDLKCGEIEESYTGERCEYDFVHITVGTWDDQVIHGPFCGFNPPAPIVFQQNVTIIFVSDSIRVFKGFEAAFHPGEF